MKKYIKTILSPKGTFKQLNFLIYQKLIKKRFQNDHNFLSFKITSKYAQIHLFSIQILPKNAPKQRLSIEIRLKKVHRINVDISLIKVTSNKVRQNEVDFSPVKITSKKVLRNDLKIYQYFLFDISM